MMYKQMKINSGFTLIELMITLAIALIMLGLVIPSFASIISSSRLTANANELVEALNLAHSEAVKRGLQVTVRRKGASISHWESGWNVFVDSDGNNAFNDNGKEPLCEAGEDCLLKNYDALPGGFTLITGSSTYQDYVTYLPSGSSKVIAGDTFRLCSEPGSAVTQRAIIVNPTGRPSVAEVTGRCG